MRIFISADMEGVAGVVAGDQLGPAGSGYVEARRLMTGEVLAAIAGARAGGADEIIVADSHGNARNIEIERLPEGVELVQGWPRPLGMMQGVDAAGCAGAFLVGHHTGAGAVEGVLAHTMSGRLIADLKVNGESCSETRINCAIAALYEVPVILASGDDAYARHVAEIAPGCLTVTTKQAHGATSARSLTPQESCARIAEAAERAVAERAGRTPDASAGWSGPVRVELIVKKRMVAELVSYLPGFERIGAHAVGFDARDAAEVSATTLFIASYDPTGAAF